MNYLNKLCISAISPFLSAGISLSTAVVPSVLDPFDTDGLKSSRKTMRYR